MVKTTLLAGLVCAVGLASPAMAQHYPWEGSLGGAIGGYKILGTTPADDVSLLALTLDRTAHVTGRYDRALAKFDRVIRPDGSAVLMRRVSHPNNPKVFAYLPESWPPVGTMGVERVHAADGSVIATREVVIPQWQVLAQPIPMNGPRVGTIIVQRDLMSDGSMQIAEAVTEPEPAVAVALLGAMEKGRPLPGQTFIVASR
ncbi:MAG TPA: hypothetical protein VK479_01005 [Micropepsaceae bacterium]|nr:hypothetical protein [Micropepsaceae bacterium]